MLRAIEMGGNSSTVTDYVIINLERSQENTASQLRKGHKVAVRCKDVESIFGIVHASGCVFTDW